MQDATSILEPLLIPKAVKADAWDAFSQSKDENDLASRLQSLDIPKEAKAQLWDLKHSEIASTPQQSAISHSDDRTALQVAKDQTVAAAKGILSPITSIPGQIEQEGLGKTIAGFVTPVGIAKSIWGSLKSVGEDVVPNVVKNSAALLEAYGGPPSPFGAAPSQAENEKAAGTAGATAGGLALAEGIAKISPRFAPKVTPTPDSLMLRAAENRANAVAAQLPSTTAPAAVINAVVKATALPRALVQEWMARKLASLEPKTPIATAIATHQPVGDIVSPSNPKVVAADEAARMAQINRNPPAVQDVTPAAPAIDVPRPTTPQFVQNQLDQARAAETPEQLYARRQAVRDAEIPPREAMAETPANVPRPGLSPIDEDILFKRAQTMGTLKAPEVNKWLGVRPDDVTHGANPGQQVLDEGLLGPTKEATQANVATSLKNAGMQLEARLKTADAKGLTIDAQTPVYDAAASATKRIGAPKDATFSAQLNGVVDDIEAKYPNLGKLKPSDAHKLKVELGNSIDWKNSDNPVNQMMKQIYRSINSSIGSVDETIAPAQRRWGNLYIADRTLKTGIAKDLVGKGTGPQPAQKFGFGVTR